VPIAVTHSAKRPLKGHAFGRRRLTPPSHSRPPHRLTTQRPGKNVFVNLDIALGEVEDVHAWTAQIFGIGTLGPLAV